MKILYVAQKFDYGRPERGYSFQHFNFFDTFVKTGNEVIYFDFISIMKKIGRKRMNDLLVKTAFSELPDIVFVFLSENEIDRKYLSILKNSDEFVTMNWFADDHWRFENYSKYYAPFFNWNITTDKNAIEKYHHNKIENVILSQWACNHFLYQKKELQKTIDVSFIGQMYGERKKFIDSLKTNGVNLVVRGYGWPDGRIEQGDMIRIFNQSKINLGLSNASVYLSPDWLNSFDNFALYNRLTKKIWRRIRYVQARNFGFQKSLSQIKGRTFEVPGCGGFLLSEYMNGIEDYFKLDREIVCFNSFEDLLEKIRYYLLHDNERENIAYSGYKKTIESHTYVNRFNQIFQEIGIDHQFLHEEKIGNTKEVADE